MGDIGVQEGLVGKQQLDKWCTLLAEHGLQVEWSQEKPESASVIGGVTQPIGVVYVPVGLAGCISGIIRFAAVEQDVPPPLPVGIVRTLQPGPRCVDDDTPAGENDLTSTRSRRPLHETTPNGDGPTRSHPTNLPTTSPRFESGKEMHGAKKKKT